MWSPNLSPLEIFGSYQILSSLKISGLSGNPDFSSVRNYLLHGAVEEVHTVIFLAFQEC